VCCFQGKEHPFLSTLFSPIEDFSIAKNFQVSEFPQSPIPWHHTIPNAPNKFPQVQPELNLWWRDSPALTAAFRRRLGEAYFFLPEKHVRLVDGPPQMVVKSQGNGTPYFSQTYRLVKYYKFGQILGVWLIELLGTAVPQIFQGLSFSLES